MSHTLTRITRQLIIPLLAGLLAACSGMPLTGGDDKLQAAADAQEAIGNYSGAAQLYLDAAATAKPPEKYRLQLQASDLLLRGNELERAGQLLEALQQAGLRGELAQRQALQRARLALALQRPDEALAILESEPASGAFAIESQQLHADALAMNSRYFSAASERIAIDGQLADPAARLANQRAIWDALNGLTDSELQSRRQAPPPDILSGWLELVELTRLYLQQPDALAEVIPHWSQRYPAHPASGAFLTSLMETMRTAGQAPSKIAVLLPLTGTLAEAAGAIRDGIMTAWYDMPDVARRPILRFHDTRGSAAGALEAYQTAVSEGALFVVGPLLKEEVEALMSLDPLPVPALGLNRVEDGKQGMPGLYQFGLAPEDEAREAARLAWREGMRRCVTLVSNDSWGERVSAAFAEEWQLLGGVLLESHSYDDAQTDHGQAISSVLNLDASRARHQALTRRLGTRLEFEPRRRQDVDFVFMVASPRQARLLRPQLSFYHASRLPVYATSRVYSGRADPARDSDMNGIRFCDTPWTLEQRGDWQHLQQAVSEFWPEDSERYARLYALGIDAYRIVPYLSQSAQGLLTTFHGVSGNLSLDGNGHINRTLRCAQFSDGVAQLIETDSGITATTP
jgi:outer membrane PBP1 activator LpoA protein